MRRIGIGRIQALKKWQRVWKTERRKEESWNMETDMERKEENGEDSG